MSESVQVYIGTETLGESRGIYSSQLDLRTHELSEPALVAEVASPCFLATDLERRLLYCTGKSSSPELPFYTVSSFAMDDETGGLTPIGSQTITDLQLCHISLALDGKVLLGTDYGHGTAVVFPLQGDGAIDPASALLSFDTAASTIPDRQDSPHVHSINTDVSGKFVFVCDFSADEVKIYRLHATEAKLETIGAVSVSPGSGPRHLVCHPNGRWVYVINELSGTVDVFSFDYINGRLNHRQSISTLPQGFSGSNTAAEIAFSPDHRFLYGSNRGHDSIVTYRLDPETGMLTLCDFTPTEGQHPRYFAIDPSGRLMLVSNRDGNNVVVFRLDEETGIPVYAGYQVELSMPMGVAIVSRGAGRYAEHS
jgi:6-phosphogluconolactonase